MIVSLTRHERPLTFFGLFAGLSLLAATVLGVPVLAHYLDTGMVPRFPTLFVASVLVVTGLLALVAGLVLDGIRKTRHEHSRLAYMRYAAVSIIEPSSRSGRIPAQPARGRALIA